MSHISATVSVSHCFHSQIWHQGERWRVNGRPDLMATFTWGQPWILLHAQIWSVRKIQDEILSCLAVFFIYIYIIFINFFFSAAGCTYPIEERTKEFSRSTDFQLFWSFSSKTALNTSINQLKSWQKHASSRHGPHLLVTSISHATIRKQYYIWASK